MYEIWGWCEMPYRWSCSWMMAWLRRREADVYIFKICLIWPLLPSPSLTTKDVYSYIPRFPPKSFWSREVYNVNGIHSSWKITSRSWCGWSVVSQFYQTEVNNEHVIRGNSAIIKCVIPSFVADFVSVASWVTDDGQTFVPQHKGYGNFFSHLYRQSTFGRLFELVGGWIDVTFLVFRYLSFYCLSLCLGRSFS